MTLPEEAVTERDGELFIEEVGLAGLAEAIGTPLYCYSSTGMRRAYRRLQAAVAPLGVRICFAVKANSNIAVIRTFAALGAGADIVSGGELYRALAAGIAPQDIVFSGVGKTVEELRLALSAGIGQVNIESAEELEQVVAVTQAMGGQSARLCFRFNPDVDAGTHAKITTGRQDNKFGLPEDEVRHLYRRAANLPGITAIGLAMHIGSQITDLQPYRLAYQRVARMVHELRTAGHTVSHLDLGGGLGIGYDGAGDADLAEFADIVRDTVTPLDCRLTVEPGRYLVAHAGLLLSRVLYRKPGRERTHLIIDAAMNDLMRPALYESRHRIVPISRRDDRPKVSYDISGPVCESTDTFAKAYVMQEMRPGEYVAILQAGAYGAVLSSTYNSRPLVPEVMVDGHYHAVIRERQPVSVAMALEALPPWLTRAAR